MEHEIWITRLFNDYLAGAGNAILGAVGVHAEHPERPWTNWITMEILVAIIIMVLFAVLKTRLSMEQPGKVQHIFEAIYGFIHKEAEDNVPHHGHHYAAFFGTIFIFVLFS